MGRLAAKLLLFAALALGFQVLISLEWSFGPEKAGGKPAHGGFLLPVRAALPEVDRYRPDSSILLFQSYMQSHPKLGFLFKGNLGAEGTVNLRWADQEPGAIHSDSLGFINSPYALQARKEGRPIDVIGVGSSFMQGAADKLHDFFWAKGLYYYSMATPRHTLPQFTAVVEDLAAPLKPKWIVYDLNEASFELITDYDAWAASGMDWFAYHSGTWCGPPAKKSDRLLAGFPTLEALYTGIRRRVHPESPIAPASDEVLVARARSDIAAARAAAEAVGARFVVLVIPSRDVAVYGKSDRWRRVAALLPLLREDGVEVLDLKPIFTAEDDPRSLYFQVDAHWNGYGIYKAGAALAMRFAEIDSRQGPAKQAATTSQ